MDFIPPANGNGYQNVLFVVVRKKMRSCCLRVNRTQSYNFNEQTTFFSITICNFTVLGAVLESLKVRGKLVFVLFFCDFLSFSF